MSCFNFIIKRNVHICLASYNAYHIQLNVGYLIRQSLAATICDPEKYSILNLDSKTEKNRI